ncbi:MAG: formylglycine-generating enzyme family protein [Alphaproteobacteria bacterium]
MSAPARPWLAAARALLARHRDDVRGAQLPRLVAYTSEDKAAKGLRSLRERGAAPEAPVHFTALEMVQEERGLLLVAPAGGGKTSFARELALCLAGDLVADPVLDVARLAGAPVRDAAGARASHAWTLGPTLHALVMAEPGMSAESALAAAGPGFDATLRAAPDAPAALLVVGDVDRLGEGWRGFAAGVVALLEAHASLRVLMLGDARRMDGWPLPAGLARHALLPLPEPERRDALASLGMLEAHAAAHPGIVGLALGVAAPASGVEGIVDAWKASATGRARDEACARPWLAGLLAAADFAALPGPGPALAAFARDPEAAAPILASLLSRWSGDRARGEALVAGLLAMQGDEGRRGALVAAPFADSFPGMRAPLRAALAAIVEAGALRPAERVAAGRALSLLGDPRDLEALVDVPGGSFAMGCATNPNSSPAHLAVVEAFRMGAYPVTNARYAAFAAATGRHWASSAGLRPERANMPAVDLTWHDARAFCDWLAAAWRRDGRIAPGEDVRLPTEREWERAARGDQPVPASGVVHPWGTDWDDDRANGETTGLNDTCAVGLFPRGRSPHGCHDMAGQVWDWCLTLWGEDMVRPSFAYPWRDDGREALDAPDRVRRVLRGGCFSSGPAKANASYRGSLEANGFWRGNGFRIVVARAALAATPGPAM